MLRDENVTCAGKVRKRKEELRSCGVRDEHSAGHEQDAKGENTRTRRTKWRRRKGTTNPVKLEPG